MKDRWRKLIPSRDSLRELSALRPVARWLHRSELALQPALSFGAAFVGLFSAFIPVPSQMLLAAIAIVTRVNLPISVALVWITNPITIPPCFMPLTVWDPGYWASTLLTWKWKSHLTGCLPTFGLSKPLVVGAFVCGLVSGSVGFLRPISFGAIVSCDAGANAGENGERKTKRQTGERIPANSRISAEIARD